MHPGGDGSLGQSSRLRAWRSSHCADCFSRASLVALKHRAVLPRRAVLLLHELERCRGGEVTHHGGASPHLGVIASHGAENSRGDDLHGHGAALIRLWRLLRHDRCVCDILLSHSFADDDDAFCVHWRGTSRWRRRSWGSWISFSSDQTKPLLRRDCAFPPKSVCYECLW